MRKCLYLDSNIFIYTIEEYAEFDVVLKRLREGILNGLMDAVTSELALSEVLVKPIADSDLNKIQAYHNSFRNGKGLTVMPVDRGVLIEAASIRASTNLKLPDAIHFATACLTNCTHFVTNDDHFKSMKHHHKIKVLPLQQLDLFLN